MQCGIPCASVRISIRCLACTVAVLTPATLVADAANEQIRIVFDGPAAIPQGACVPELTFRAINQEGSELSEFSGAAHISGLRVRPTDNAGDGGLQKFSAEVAFESGRLTLTPDTLNVSQLSVSGYGIRVRIQDDDWHFPVSGRSSWWRLLPPVTAIVLAVLLRDVTVALIAATLSGCLLYFPVTGFTSAIPMLCNTIVQQMADDVHASVILFTVLLGAMIGLMNDSGGTRAAIDRLSRFADSRRKGMVLTWLMGLVIFFDDYANTLLIGGATQPLSDRLKFSRAKLAFLIDATAAPVAGLAISTWTAFEIDQVSAGFEAAGIEADAGRFFWSTIPYRIYPLLMIGFVAAVAVSGRDFGPMLKAERVETTTESARPAERSANGSIWYTVLPVGILVLTTVTGFLLGIDAYQLLLAASFLASTLAYLLPLVGRRMSLKECSHSWTAGIASMIPATIILILAWAVSGICQSDRLDAAGFIVETVGRSVQPELLPAISFLAAGGVAVAIGSSFTTMALLVPMLIPLAWSLLSGSAVEAVSHPIFAATVGAILAGAIFGDHCSPISDTTVLSSAAAGCDHLQHVATQLPYALLTAVASVLLGYLPIGYGIPWWICLPIALAACVGGVVFLGKHPHGRAN